jgi:hypothetical protein
MCDGGLTQRGASSLLYGRDATLSGSSGGRDPSAHTALCLYLRDRRNGVAFQGPRSMRIAAGRSRMVFSID